MENCKLKSEEDNINNVIYNNDTSNYKDITYNKKDETIKLFDKFDEYIISIFKRNYGLYVRLLKVEDTQNILNYTYQIGAEPLCMTYKIFNKMI